MKTTKLWSLLFLLLSHITLSIAQKPPEHLVLGEKLNISVQPNIQNRYTLKMEKGEFALLNLRQQDVDVKVVTYAPYGLKIEEFDSTNGIEGNELMVIDAPIGPNQTNVNPLCIIF